MSYRDYWFATLDDGMVLVISRDSESRRVLVSAMTVVNGQPKNSLPQEADFDPDDLVVGSVMASANNNTRTVVKLTAAPRLAFTGGTQ